MLTTDCVGSLAARPVPGLGTGRVRVELARQGPVLQPFSYDESHPYASGQHRGIDIGADAAGQTGGRARPPARSASPATVPTNGRVGHDRDAGRLLRDADAPRLDRRREGRAASPRAGSGGTIGPSGTPEQDGPYVHLGIRVTTDPDGYLDPLSFLPPAATGGGTDDPARRDRFPAGQRPPVLLPSRRRPFRAGEGLRLRPTTAASHTMRTAVPGGLARKSSAYLDATTGGAFSAAHCGCVASVQSKPRHFAEPESFVRRPVVDRRLHEPAARLRPRVAAECVSVGSAEVHRAAATSPQRRRCTDRRRRSAPHRLWPTSPLDGERARAPSAASAARGAAGASRAPRRRARLV